MNNSWHQLKIEEVLKILNTNPETGLNFEEVFLRQEKYGLNKLPEEKGKSNFYIFLSQFFSPLVYILFIAGILSFIFHDFWEGLFILIAVFLNAFFGSFQEKKAKNILKEIKKEISHFATVLREGNLKEILQEELVPGDIIFLKAGDKVPADARVIESLEGKVNEAILTGEWLPMEKENVVLKQNTPLAERKNMVFFGTELTKGIIKAVVVETGLRTELGKLGKALIEIKEEKTPLQKKIAHFSKILLIVVIICCALIFIDGIVNKFNLLEVLITTLAVAVAAVPEGLPITLTIVLALGMQRILKAGGLVKNLASVETLGSASVIGMDKTGTLTTGEMEIKEVLGEEESLKIALLNNQAYLENPEEKRDLWVIRGEPEEKAILLKGLESFPYHEILNLKKGIILKSPFNSEKKYSACLFLEDHNHCLGIVGAPDKLLKLASKDDQLKWEKVIEEKTNEGYRLIGCAFKKLTQKELKENREFIEKKIFPHHLIKNLQFLGILLIEDPLREEAKEAILKSLEAGIQPIIISGDHKRTVKKIAQEIGLIFDEKEIIEGQELDKMSDLELEERVKNFKVIARAEPQHKLKIIEKLQKRKEIVAMTGDGVNDALSLKKADIGIALHSGTEVAKSASDLILLNDSFAVILKAIEEGRRIINNLRKIITYLLSDSFTEMILIGFSIFFRMPLPVNAVQILWVNIIEDTLPNVALAFEPKERDILKEKPKEYQLSLLTKEMFFLMFVIGIITDLLLLSLYFILIYFSSYNLSHIRTIIFASLAIDSLFLVFSLKSLKKNLSQIKIFSNRFLNFSVLLGSFLLFLSVYFPPFQKLLKTYPLNAVDWFLVFSLGVLNLLLVEFGKWLFISKKK
ncbi:MAG: cation-translocating P-type ATPase [Minisyncoccia bacterium]